MKKILLSSLLAVMAVTSANAKIASTEYADGVAASEAAAAETAANTYTDGLTGDVVNSDYIKGLPDKTLTGAVEDLDSRVGGLTGTGNQAAATKKELADGLATKLDKDQGVSNAGKGLIVDDTGNLALAEVATDAELATVSGVANNAKTIAEGAVAVNTQQGTAINAINNGEVMKSGITAAKVTQYDGYASGKQDTLSTEQMAAVNSGATKAKIDAIATNTTAINTINDGEVMNSGITAAKVTQYDGYASGKQDALSTDQLNAVNSGITAAKVTQYDGYASGKQDTLSTEQMAAVNSGATAAIISATSAFQAAVEAGTVNEEGTYVLTAKVDAQTKKVTGYAWENIDRSYE
ncbi:MAG: hypothetical protein IKL14_05375 [Alphaproteobacteria bacterium]|nr:hypothetical protein [Alphaproteobacteria bacterium]